MSTSVSIEVAKPGSLGPEHNPWFWNPGLYGARLAPHPFRESLHEVDPDLEATWNPILEKWAIFYRTPRVTHPISRGWRLLFFVQDENRSYVPLDERTLAKCWEISGRKWGSAAKYMDAVHREAVREREQQDKALSDEDWYLAGEYHDFTRPKIGFGRISESKMVGQ